MILRLKSLWYTHDDVNGVHFWMEYPRRLDRQPGRILQSEMQIEENGNQARHYGLVTANPSGSRDFEKKPGGTGEMRIPSGECVTFRDRFLFHTGDVKQANIAGEYRSFAERSPE